MQSLSNIGRVCGGGTRDIFAQGAGKMDKQGDRREIFPDFRQVCNCVFFLMDPAPSGPPPCTNTEADRAFLCCLHRVVAAAIDLETTPSTFIERVLGLNQLWTMLNNPARTFMSTALLIGGGHIDDVALKPYTAALEKKHRHCLHSDHLLHIKGTATVNKAICDITREWVMRPLLRLYCDDIGMRHQQEWRRRSIALEPGDECATILARSHYFTGDTCGLKEGVQIPGCTYLVARWVAGIKLEQTAYICGSLFSNLLPVDDILIR